MAIQATRVLQHQTRIPNANASSSSTSSSITNDANAKSVQIKHLHRDQNGIEQDPWIKRTREQQDQQIPASTGKF